VVLPIVLVVLVFLFFLLRSHLTWK
jgi:hypothetical protein